MTEQKTVEQQKTEQDRPSHGPGPSGTRGASENEDFVVGRESRAKERIGTDQGEVEWQFDAADLRAVEGWLEEYSSDSGLSVVPGSIKELTDTYYDTEDWRLYRAGYALRVRKVGHGYEATMKSLASATGAGGSLRRRREISEPLDSDEVGALLRKKRLGTVGERLRMLVGVRELHSLFEVRTRRRTYDLFDIPNGNAESLGKIVEDASGDIRRKGDNFLVGEVALDQTQVLPGDELIQLKRVEVEMDSSATDAFSVLEGFVGKMEEELNLQPTSTSKFEAGLIASRLKPEETSDLGPTVMEDSLSVGEVAFRVLRRQFAAMRAHEPGTRLGEDAEELHDMRVATRRMRSALKLFEDALPERARFYRWELKFFAGVLGDVRDLDVQIEQFKGRAEEAGEGGREPLLKVVDVLEERRAAARERLLEVLDSERYERFESSFAALLRQGPGIEAETGRESGDHSAAAEPILAAAPVLVSRGYRKWRKAAKRVEDSSSSPEEYHDLRKKGKRLRYALEFLSGVYGEKATGKVIKHLKTLQDGLGRHQDLIVEGDLLKELATDDQRIPPRIAFEMGVLAERGLREAADLREALPASKAYRTLRKGKSWKKLEEFMEKRRSKKLKGKKEK